MNFVAVYLCFFMKNNNELQCELVSMEHDVGQIYKNHDQQVQNWTWKYRISEK